MIPIAHRHPLLAAVAAALLLELFVLAAWGLLAGLEHAFPGTPPRRLLLLVTGLVGLTAGAVAWREYQKRIAAEVARDRAHPNASSPPAPGTTPGTTPARRDLAREVAERTRALEEANLVLQTEIQERRRIADTLKNSRALYHSLVENLPVHVWRTNRNGTYTFGNEHLMDCLGVAAEEFLGKTPADFYTAQTAAKFLADDQWVLNSGDPREVIEEFVTLDGRSGWVQTLKTPFHDPQGELLGVQGISWDITERKRAEAEMQRIQTRLEEVNRNLVSQHQEIQNFYHTLSHELKTPLTSAREFVSIVMDGLAGPLTPTQREYLGIAMDSCNQLRVCINDLLDATRLETGKFSLELKPISLGQSLQRLISVMTPAVTRKGIRLESEIDPDLPEVIADENRLQQVINNLLTNALKFTPEGGRILVQARLDSGSPPRVIVAVTDTGCGIPPAQQERIFDRLYQIKTGDAATEQGVGLGLYICRELVKLHGGSIEVESEPGRGSTFRVILPLDASQASPRILIVDDDPGLRDLLRQILERENFRVSTAENGHAALDSMRRETADVVLLDLIMDGMDGADTIREIRREWDTVPVILHTGYPDEDAMARALECSPVTLLAKPCPPDQLVRTLRGALHGRDRSVAAPPSSHPRFKTEALAA